MALALYRRYRPDTFAGVIGQDQVVIPLSRALDAGKLTHAYLFSGPRGCGKTSSARILARCINCVKGPTSHPCGECESCRDLGTNGSGSIDVVEIDAASHNGVDDARELRERAGFAPARDRYKIFILDEAHMVTQQGFNALLKIVEEPPDHVMFIFATTEPDKVIGTIRSRTHHYPFRLVPPEIMGPYLEQVCQQESIQPAPGVLKLAMRAGGGSVRDTLSVLDQLMVGSVDGEISYDSATALLGFTPDALISSAVDAVISQDGAALYAIVEKVVVGGFEPRRFVEDLLARVRDLLVLTLAGSQAVGVLSQDAEAEDVGLMTTQAKALGLRKLTAIAQTINDTLAGMAGAVSPRMRLELLAAQLLAGVGKMAAPATSAQAAPATVEAGQGQAVGRSRGGFNPPPRTVPVSASTAAPAAVPAPAATSFAARPVAVGQDPALAAPYQPAATSGKTSPAPSAAEAEQAVSGAAEESAAGVVAPATAPTGSSTATTAPASLTELAAEPLASDQDRWKLVLHQLPPDLSRYVDSTKVPIVEFSVNQRGGRHLVFTFDTPLSQHMFALAVTADNKGVPGIVQAEVRTVFGPTASIAPNTVAANGEAVQTVSSMSPQQQAQVKRAIAQSAMQAVLATGTAGGRAPTTGSKSSGSTTEEADGDSDSGDLDREAWPAEPGEDLAAVPMASVVSTGSNEPARQLTGSAEGDQFTATSPHHPATAPAFDLPVPTGTAAPRQAQLTNTVGDLEEEDDPWADQPDEEEPTEADPAAAEQAESSHLGPVAARRQAEQAGGAAAAPGPAVSAEDDVYSADDQSSDDFAQVDLETLKKILDVKEVREIPPSETTR